MGQKGTGAAAEEPANAEVTTKSAGAKAMEESNGSGGSVKPKVGWIPGAIMEAWV